MIEDKYKNLELKKWSKISGPYMIYIPCFEEPKLLRQCQLCQGLMGIGWAPDADPHLTCTHSWRGAEPQRGWRRQHPWPSHCHIPSTLWDSMEWGNQREQPRTWTASWPWLNSAIAAEALTSGWSAWLWTMIIQSLERTWQHLKKN